VSQVHGVLVTFGSSEVSQVTLTVTQRADLELAIGTYQENVVLAKDYLEGRGITGRIAGLARLGVVQRPMPGHEDMVDRLAIPYLTPSGAVDVRFRCRHDHSCKELGHPKYLTLAGKQPRLYNAGALTVDHDTACICEGELDALIIQYHLGLPAVGVPGAQAWTGHKHFPRMFRAFSRVLVFADADDAGRDLAKQIVRDVNQATIVRLAEGSDVTDTYLSEGVEGLAERAGLWG
jgi:hypothetical protein